MHSSAGGRHHGQDRVTEAPLAARARAASSHHDVLCMACAERAIKRGVPRGAHGALHAQCITTRCLHTKGMVQKRCDIVHGARWRQERENGVEVHGRRMTRKECKNVG